VNISPDNRLIVWTGVVLAVFTLFPAAIPVAAPLCYGAIALFGVLVMVDAARSRRLLDHIRLEMPAIVRMTRGREMDIPVRLVCPGSRQKRIRVGIPFPGQIAAAKREMWVDLPPENGGCTLQWPCRALDRGRSYISTGYLEAPSPLGFWARRRKAEVSCEIRSYPDLTAERRTLAALFLHGGLGLHSQKQIGKGRDFEQLRDYLPGDAYEDIDWKATAKRGTPVSKVYQIERTQNVYVIIDTSRLGGRNAAIFNRGFQGRQRTVDGKGKDFPQDTILERFLTAALALGTAAERQGDNFGAAAFSDRMLGFRPARSGRPHYQSCRDMLYRLAPEGVTPDFSEAFTFLATRVRKRSLLVFLTCLDDPVLAEHFLAHIDILKKRHLLMVTMLKPAAAHPLFSTKGAAATNEIYSRLAGHLLWGSLRETGKTLQRSGAGFFLLDNEALGPQLITQYLDVKKRQLL